MRLTQYLYAFLTVVAAAAFPLRADPLLPSTGELNPPSGDLVGYAGETLIWGLTMVNTDANGYWWVIDSVESDYISTGAPGEIPDGANFFTDDLTPYFDTNFLYLGTALAPGEDINVDSPGDPVDLAEFAISPTADPGTISAQLHIVYDAFDGNPFDGGTDIGQYEFDVDTSITVLASQSSAPSVPEPGTLGMAAAAWLLMVWQSRNRGRRPR